MSWPLCEGPHRRCDICGRYEPEHSDAHWVGLLTTLEAENVRLREALEEICKDEDGDCRICWAKIGYGENHGACGRPCALGVKP